jgi:hypothetical protein
LASSALRARQIFSFSAIARYSVCASSLCAVRRTSSSSCSEISAFSITSPASSG